MADITINPRPGEYGIDPGPIRYDDKEIKFKYFWWWFTNGKWFIPVAERLPEDNAHVEGIFVCEEDGLPCNGFFFYRKGKFYLRSDKSPGKFEVTHWRLDGNV